MMKILIYVLMKILVELKGLPVYVKALTKNRSNVRLCSYFKPLKAFGLDTSTRSTETLNLSKKENF